MATKVRVSFEMTVEPEASVAELRDAAEEARKVFYERRWTLTVADVPRIIIVPELAKG